jgi:hypothetical protein
VAKRACVASEDQVRFAPGEPGEFKRVSRPRLRDQVDAERPFAIPLLESSTITLGHGLLLNKVSAVNSCFFP